MNHANDEGRLSWLVGKARRLISDTVIGDSSPNQLSLRQVWQVATGGCPYISNGGGASQEMRCPFAAAGQTELPPGHPQIPGMVLPSKAESVESVGAAAKLLAVAKSTSANSTSAAPDCSAATTVQAAARGMLARQQQQQREVQRPAFAARASNLTSLGRPSAMATTLPNLSFIHIPNASVGSPGGAAGALEQLVDVD